MITDFKKSQAQSGASRSNKSKDNTRKIYKQVQTRERASKQGLFEEFTLPLWIIHLIVCFTFWCSCHFWFDAVAYKSVILVYIQTEHLKAQVFFLWGNNQNFYEVVHNSTSSMQPVCDLVFEWDITWMWHISTVVHYVSRIKHGLKHGAADQAMFMLLCEANGAKTSTIWTF